MAMKDGFDPDDPLRLFLSYEPEAGIGRDRAAISLRFVMAGIFCCNSNNDWYFDSISAKSGDALCWRHTFARRIWAAAWRRRVDAKHPIGRSIKRWRGGAADREGHSDPRS
jgi:hypothetical protein